MSSVANAALLKKNALGYGQTANKIYARKYRKN